MDDFNKVAKDRSYTEIYYPFAEKGPILLRSIQNYIFFSILCKLLSVGLTYVSQMINPNRLTTDEISTLKESIDTMSNFQYNVMISSAEFASSIGLIQKNDLYSVSGIFMLAIKGMLQTISSIFVMMSVVCLIISIFETIRYVINVIKRNREYERNVIKNDFKAVWIYRRLMNSLKISARLREAKKAAKPKTSGSSYESPSTDSLSKVEELKAMKKLRVQVNTRQKLGLDTISTVYLIFIDLPTDDTTTTNLLKRIESLDETTTRVVKGEVVMGKHMLTDDRQHAIFRGETVEEVDPYNFKERLKVVEEQSQEEIEYESSYSLSNFVDNREEIKQRTEGARGWAERQGKMLDSYLITGKMNVTRYRTIVSSTKATFIYDLAHDSSLSTNHGKLDESLDKTFGLRGATSRIEEGKFIVVFPMPKDYRIPIDLPTLYKEAFG